MKPDVLDRRRKSKVGRVVPLLLGWFAQNARDLPWRRTRDPYAIWVSEIMLQQTQVKTVVPYWERWMGRLPTIDALANARSHTLHKLWEGLGYYTRVRNLQKAARFINKHHSGRFPERYDQVLALPGIGRYTAGAVCSIAFNQPVPVLDGNVIRVLTRLFGIVENPRHKPTNTLLWRLAEALVKRAAEANDESPGDSGGLTPRASHLNQSLMELGALICTPRQPRCALCPVARSCAARRLDCVERLPNLASRNGSIPRRFTAFVLRRGGRLLVRQRPDGGINARLWEFPNTEMTEAGATAINAAAKSVLGCQPEGMRPLCVIKHSITRYRITVEVFVAQADKTSSRCLPEGRWLRRRQLESLSFPSAHRKILARLDELGFDN